MTVNTPSRTATVEELRHTINRLQVRANVTRNHPPRTFHAFLHARHLALAAAQDFHVFLVSGVCLAVIAGVFAIGIPTQIKLFRTRRELTALLR